MFRRFNMKKLILLFSLLLLSFATIGGTLSYLMAKAPALTNLFQPALEPYGDVTISKMVEHTLGEDYQLPEELAFEFVVDLTADYANRSVTLDTGDTLVLDENGTGTISVKPGIPVTLKQIAKDTVVTVTEKDKAGFTEKNGQSSRAVTVRSQESHELAFINTYSPAAAPANITIGGTKILEGRDWMEGDAFQFQLNYLKHDGEVKDILVDTQTISYDVENPEYPEYLECPRFAFDMTTLQALGIFDQMGTHSFSVSEVEGDISGIGYSEVVYYFDIVIGDADMDGSLEIQSVSDIVPDAESGLYNVETTFTNTYAATGIATAAIQIQKHYVDEENDELDPKGFTFELYKDDVYVEDIGPTTSAGVLTIPFTYTIEDIGHTYKYTVKEKNDSKGGVTYDETVYDVVITVQDNLDGTIGAVVTEGSPEITFTNSYDPTDIQETISGTKKLENRSPRAGEFTFELYKTGADFNIDGVQPVDTVTNEENGSFAFDVLTLDKAQTYYYVVKENTSDPAAYIIYDENEYHISIEVEDQNGVLTVVDKTIVDKKGLVDKIVFVNEYIPSYARFTLGGKKTFTNGELKEDMFTFDLYEANADYAKVGLLSSATNEEDGSFSFASIAKGIEEVKPADGIFYYIIEENTDDKLENVIYDTRVYHVEVTISDDMEGHLSAVTKVMLSDGTVVEEAVFENEYVAPTPTPTPEVTPTPDDEDPTPEVTPTPGEEDPTPSPTPGPDGDEPATGPGPDEGGTNTGDNSNISVYIILMLSASILIFGIIVWKKKKMV